MTPRRTVKAGARSNAFVPLDAAISKVLYTFCKVRGEKVIVRFLNVEAKYLEPLLSSIEEAEQFNATDSDEKITWSLHEWTWEQRYVVLLWLSHLLFAPFDLSTISSVDFEDASLPKIPGLELGDNLPGITLRIIPLAIRYLSSPGKERDAAKALLVRIAMRRDMQEMGVLKSLVYWATASLRPQQDVAPGTTYFYLGVLSFLAGVLRLSSETSDMNAYLVTIFNTVHATTQGDNSLSKSVSALALARKMIIKVIRSIVVIFLRHANQDMQSTEIIEMAISYLLDSLSDNDTPVRMSASKSLSVITLKLDPEMASQVVEAVLGSLNQNVLWNKEQIKQGARPVRDLSAVSQLEWHGLVLTLSHLLYRRSPPASQLSDIIHALILGLSFEQRGISGGSVGSNVRDAACFGIWALARRYTTDELLAVPTHSVFAAKAHPSSSSIIQVLATELVTTASLDPFGNIRRGSSAALQELIGRHPDTVQEGISVVQGVDYHAVARRSRAVEEVATNATKLANQYGEALLDGILGWRGIGDMDAPARRDSGAAFGRLTSLLSKADDGSQHNHFEDSFNLIKARLNALAKRQVEERHGLLLCFASLLDQFPLLSPSQSEGRLIGDIMATVEHILQGCSENTYRRPELVAEAASRLAVSVLPVLQVAMFGRTTNLSLQPGHQLLSPARAKGYVEFLNAVSTLQTRVGLVDTFLAKLREVIMPWLDYSEPETIEPASTAALLVLVMSKNEDRTALLLEWAKLIQYRPASRATIIGQGYFHVLAMAQPLAEATSQDGEWDDVVSEAFLARWISDRQVETRVAILQSLIRARVLQNKPIEFLTLLVEGLNDYTTNARGDVGSQVRVQALKAAQGLWEGVGGVHNEDEWVVQSVQKLFYLTLCLSAEKLDRVRPEAQAALALLMREDEASVFKQQSPSSKPYFSTLLGLLTSHSLHPIVSATAIVDRESWISRLMAGFVTSADTGQEELVITSRAALTEYCEGSPANLDLICNALVYNLKAHTSEDRVVVPTLEIIAFLFHVGIFARSTSVDMRKLCLQTQRVGYKTGNVRKITACVKVYGGVAALSSGEGSHEARERLGALMFHPWPRVRSAVVDEVWGLGLSGDDEATAKESLLGVDWGTADKGAVKSLVEGLQLP
jgi:hypothetical protein